MEQHRINSTECPPPNPLEPPESTRFDDALALHELASLLEPAEPINPTRTLPAPLLPPVKNEEKKEPARARKKEGNRLHQCNLCDFSCKQATNMTRHKANRHNVDIKWLRCKVFVPHDSREYMIAKAKAEKTAGESAFVPMKKEIDGLLMIECPFVCKEKGSMKRHKANMHNIDVRWFECVQPGCNYKTKEAASLRKHEAFIHNQKVKWNYCSFEECNYKAKQASSLKTHYKYQHDLGEWFRCAVDGCTFKTKIKHKITKHTQTTHDVGASWLYCNAPGCKKKFNNRKDLKQHTKESHSFCQEVPGEITEVEVPLGLP